MKLSDSQQKAFELALAGNDLFVAGKEGTGKSTLAKYIYEKLKEAGKNVILASATTRDAFELGGVSVKELLKLKNNGINIATQRMVIHKTTVLIASDTIIVDDVSRANIALMDTLLCTIAKTEENGTKKQLIVLGDFFLPAPELPVEERVSYKEYYPNININDAYAFKAPNWFKRAFSTVSLDYPPFVPKDKANLISSIININNGEKFINYSMNHLAPRYKSVYSANICFSQQEADELNQKGFDEIDENSFILRARVKSETKAPVKTELFGIPKILELKVGQKVVLLEDSRSHGSDIYDYHKGSIAIIKKIVPRQYVTVELSNRVQVNIKAVRSIKKRYDVENGKIKEIESIQIIQFPLKPAYAISLDDCRNLSFDSAIILNGEKNSSFFYSALSHCNNLEAVYFSNIIKLSDLSISQEVIEFHSDPSKKKYSWNTTKKYIKKVSAFYEDMIPGYKAIDDVIHDMKYSNSSRAKILMMILDMANKLREEPLLDDEE